MNKSLVFNGNSSSTGIPVNPTVYNNKSLSRNSSAEKRVENVGFSSFTAHSLQNAKNTTIRSPNVNSLRNKIG